MNYLVSLDKKLTFPTLCFYFNANNSTCWAFICRKYVCIDYIIFVARFVPSVIWARLSGKMVPHTRPSFDRFSLFIQTFGLMKSFPQCSTFLPHCFYNCHQSRPSCRSQCIFIRYARAEVLGEMEAFTISQCCLIWSKLVHSGKRFELWRQVKRCPSVCCFQCSFAMRWLDHFVFSRRTKTTFCCRCLEWDSRLLYRFRQSLLVLKIFYVGSSSYLPHSHSHFVENWRTGNDFPWGGGVPLTFLSLLFVRAFSALEFIFLRFNWNFISYKSSSALLTSPLPKAKRKSTRRNLLSTVSIAIRFHGVKPLFLGYCKHMALYLKSFFTKRSVRVSRNTRCE